MTRSRGEVEDARFEAKAKDTKKILGQRQPFRGQTLSRPRTGMLEAKAKDQEHKRLCSPKKKKKVFTKIFQAISTKRRFPKNFSSAPQNFNNSKNTAVLEPRTGQFSRTWGLEAKAKTKAFKMCPRGLHLWPDPQREILSGYKNWYWALLPRPRREIGGKTTAFYLRKDKKKLFIANSASFC